MAMSDQLAGLFGSGADADVKKAKANAFVNKVTAGTGDSDFDPEEAKGYLNQVLGKADSGQVESATRQALNNLNPDQQKEFGTFVDQLKKRDPSSPKAGSYDVDEISKMFGQAGGPATSLDDLLGGLMGGLSGGTGGSSTANTGGIGGMLSSLLGSLSGGSKTSSSTKGNDSGDFDLGALMNSPIGKTVMASIAAFLMKNMMGGRN
jgi:hypothetical protein